MKRSTILLGAAPIGELGARETLAMTHGGGARFGGRSATWLTLLTFCVGAAVASGCGAPSRDESPDVAVAKSTVKDPETTASTVPPIPTKTEDLIIQDTIWDDASMDPPCNDNFPKGCMVFVPGDRFLMGAQATDPNAANYNSAAQPSEGPVHERRVHSVWFHMKEVTTSMYARCVYVGACDVKDIETSGGVFNFGVKGRPEYPANGITWAGAKAYCTWIGGRLPTEAEWEYASRGSTYQNYPWGDHDSNCVAVSSRAAGSGCVPHGTVDDLKAEGMSVFWVWDMSGSVWEWTSDAYSKDSYGKWLDGSAGPAVSHGPRVIRGGGWLDEEFSDLRTTARGAQLPNTKFSDVGFRCVRDSWSDPGMTRRPEVRVIKVPIPGTDRVERVRIWIPGRYRLPLRSRENSPKLLFYFDDTKTDFDDPAYGAVLRQAQLRNWVFVQPELSQLRGRVLGCHSPDVIRDVDAIYSYVITRFRFNGGGSYAIGHGTGAYLSILWGRTAPWLWASMVSWGPVHDLQVWLAHQLEHGPEDAKKELIACWGPDPNSSEVQERSRRLSPSSNRGGTQDGRHYVIAPVAPEDSPGGWMAPEAVRAYNWLLAGTRNKKMALKIAEEPELASALSGRGGSPRSLGEEDAQVSVVYSVRMENVAMLLLHPEQKVNLDFVFGCLDGTLAIP